MAFLNLVFGANESQTSIGSLQLDALLTEDTNLPSIATQYPVEDGSVISDHITRESTVLALSGVVTSAGMSLFSPGGRTKLVQAKDVLQRIHNLRLPVTITTGMGVYNGYAMTSARIGRSNEGEKLTVDCTFLEIRKTQVELAAIPTDTVAPETDTDGDVIPGAGARGRAGKTAAPMGTVSPSNVFVPDVNASTFLGGLF